jgi:hypothetical protein
MKHYQRGISFIGMLFVAIVFGGGFLLAAQVAPTLIEFQTITKAATKAAAGSTVAEVRSNFDKTAQIDDITSISGKDLDVSKQGDKIVVAFAYNKEIHLGGPAYLLLKYEGRSK